MRIGLRPMQEKRMRLLTTEAWRDSDFMVVQPYLTMMVLPRNFWMKRKDLARMSTRSCPKVGSRDEGDWGRELQIERENEGLRRRDGLFGSLSDGDGFISVLVANIVLFSEAVEARD
ncbi:acetylglutamate kinase [Pyrus ussuriensis x Pyrus communis]|uniref:Acetylglutamate kinase n=1 Tax=Pyrus ussuriensis x Pyrus communis TaxID=2448454 RepID=A0A5N5GHC7_9ROSA|nr:acetylglutamate kinase [Pyrus ussuriensis x Pyrus communis]